MWLLPRLQWAQAAPKIGTFAAHLLRPERALTRLFFKP
jgi:hypothetical protein